MKKLIVLFLGIVLAFSLAACGGGEEPAAPTDSGALGDYEVTIKSYEIMEDYDGNDAIVVSYDFTNNSEETTSFDVACMYSLFQNGVELEFTSVYPDPDSFDAINDVTMTEIKPGTTIEIKTCHILSDLTSPVDVEVEEFLGNGDKIVKTFELE